MKYHAIHFFVFIAFMAGAGSQQWNTALAGPITFSNFPAPLQLYARDWTNTATVPINGSVSAAGYDSVIVKVYKNSALWKQKGQPLAYSGGSASFDVSTPIDAGMIEYTFKTYLRNGNNLNLIATADSVVCGDAYLIAGQSNAHPTDTVTTHLKSEFCRTLGVQTTNQNYDAYNPADTLWGYSTDVQPIPGDNGQFSGPYVVGEWGLRLQMLILQTDQVPTAIINGAAGGSPIETNLRQGNPLDLTTIYGKMLYRTKKARLTDKIRAIFWYQGESNTFSYPSPAGDTVYRYYDFFKELYTAWKQDYPNVQKFYVFQIRPSGCGPSDPKLWDLQRTLGDSLPNIDVMSTCALPGHNGCHYDYTGYSALADNIFRLVQHDFYFSTDSLNIHPPNIAKAYYTTAAHNEIALLFREKNSGVAWPNDTTIWSLPRSMKDYIFLDDKTGLIRGGTTSGDTIKIQLTQTVNATTITYLPQKYYPGSDSVVYEGPYIYNKRGVGALAFYHFPIKSNPGLGVKETNGSHTPTEFGLEQNYPNPFNPTTDIGYRMPDAGFVTLKIFNILGEEVATLINQIKAPGEYHISWNATGIPSGVYFYRLDATNIKDPSKHFSQVRKMNILK